MSTQPISSSLVAIYHDLCGRFVNLTIHRRVFVDTNPTVISNFLTIRGGEQANMLQLVARDDVIRVL